MDYGKAQLIAHLRNLGHKIELPLIVGVRSKADKPNDFDDRIYLLTTDGFFKFKGTTNPGTDWLLNFMNPKGTAVLKLGQWKYKFGTHKGYEALNQAEPFTVHRDKNKDLKSDETGVLDTGYFGINIHRSNPNIISKLIGKWSAGCQVFADPKEFSLFMDELKKSGKQEFLYSLIKEF